MLSWVADGAPGGYNRATRQRGTLTGTPTLGETGALGTTLAMTGTNGLAFTLAPAVVESNITFWVLFEPTSFAAAQDLVSTANGASTGWGLQVDNTGLVNLREIAGGNVYAASPAISINTPYLAACSVQSGVVTLLVRRGDTGAIVATLSGAVATPSASNGQPKIGASAFDQNAVASKFAAAAYSLTSLSLSQMVALSADPWGP